jgi:hypothetical protein
MTENQKNLPTPTAKGFDVYIGQVNRAIKHLTVAHLIIYDSLTIYRDPVLLELRESLSELNDKLVDRFKILKNEFGTSDEVGYGKKEDQ